MRSSLAYLSIAYLLLGLGSAGPNLARTKSHTHTRGPLTVIHPSSTSKKHPSSTNGLHSPSIHKSSPHHRPGRHGPKKNGTNENNINANRHPVDKKLFERMVRYARFTAASGVTGQCPNPPYDSSVVAYIDKKKTSTQARIYLDHKHKEIIISFPGSKGRIDNKLDGEAQLTPYKSPGVKCAGCQVHTGFLTAWNSVAKHAHGIVSKAVKHHKGYKVVITGHSLGAAIGTLAYASFHGQGLPVRAVYTYGSPRVGEKKFASFIDKISGASESNPGTVHRITHAGDPVTQEPGTDAGYQHVKTEFWQSGKDVEKAKTTYRCIGNEPANCVNGHQSGDINDHLHYSNLDFTDPTPWCNTQSSLSVPPIFPPPIFTTMA